MFCCTLPQRRAGENVTARLHFGRTLRETFSHIRSRKSRLKNDYLIRYHTFRGEEFPKHTRAKAAPTPIAETPLEAGAGPIIWRPLSFCLDEPKLAGSPSSSNRDDVLTTTGPERGSLIETQHAAGHAAQQAVRHVDTVGVRVAAGQQEAEEPARILLQLPCAQPQPMGRILRALPRQGHAARQGAESRGEEATRGDLRDHGGQGSVRSLTAGGDRRPGRACVSIAKNAHRKGESLLTEL